MTIKHAIVFGAPRSGTSFLMDALEALPDAECVSGNLLPVGIAHLAAQEQLPGDVREALERSFRGALRDYMDSAAYRSRSAALRKWWISGRRPAALRDAAEGRRTESMLIYKEPFLALAPAFAYEALPDARLIYIHRDGRDVADSLVRSYDVLSEASLLDLEANEAMVGRAVGERYVPSWVGEGEQDAFLAATQYVRALWMWREMVARSRAFLERPDVVASGRVLAVRYEALMSDPVAHGELICGHLGQPLAAPMRRRLEQAHTSSVGIHARRAESEVLEAQALAGRELEALGYELHPGAA